MRGVVVVFVTRLRIRLIEENGSFNGKSAIVEWILIENG